MDSMFLQQKPVKRFTLLREFLEQGRGLPAILAGPLDSPKIAFYTARMVPLDSGLGAKRSEGVFS